MDDGLPIQSGDEELLGQVDGVESGEVTGWACLRGYLARPLQVCLMASLPDSIYNCMHCYADFKCSSNLRSVYFCKLHALEMPCPSGSGC